MKRFTTLAPIFTLALLVLALPAIASAQWRNDPNRNDPYYGGNNRNDPYYGNNNGGYNRNIRGAIESLKNRARNLEKQLDRMDNRSNDRYGRNNRIDNLENLTDQFARATDNLADAYGRGRNLNNSRDEAERVLGIGSQLENEMGRSRGGGRNGNGDWSQIRNDLRVVADAYGLGYYNGGRNQNRNSNWRNRVPFPLPF